LQKLCKYYITVDETHETECKSSSSSSKAQMLSIFIKNSQNLMKQVVFVHCFYPRIIGKVQNRHNSTMAVLCQCSVLYFLTSLYMRILNN